MARETAYATPAARKSPPAERGDASAAEPELRRLAGPAAAVLLAAGLASFTLGLLSMLTAASARVSDALTLSDRVGELSGLTTVSVIVFFGAWAVLGLAWRRADPPLERVAAAAAVLIALGLLGTFPPFFNAIG
jgi:hypothetical protein